MQECQCACPYEEATGHCIPHDTAQDARVLPQIIVRRAARGFCPSLEGRRASKTPGTQAWYADTLEHMKVQADSERGARQGDDRAERLCAFPCSRPMSDGKNPSSVQSSQGLRLCIRLCGRCSRVRHRPWFSVLIGWRM